MKLYRLLYLLLVLICGYYAQGPTTPVPEWNGDPSICTVDPSAPPAADPPLPIFPTQTEFTLERIEVKHLSGVTLPSELTLYQYLYDYDANKVILIENKNGFIDVNYFYYGILKKSTYLGPGYCVVSDINKNIDTDGTSAIQLQDGTWHVRPLNEFLLFSSNDPRRPLIRPKYVGQSMVRGIPVDQWATCIVDKVNFLTSRRVWSFAQKGFTTPVGTVQDLAVPVQGIVNASILLPNGTQFVEFDEIFNIYSYRPGIIESSDQLVPPKGVFCNSGPDQNLISLRDAGIEWPDRFSVRVEASSSRNSRWQRFHLRYDRGRERGSRRIRYDYMPPGGEDIESVILDYGTNLTYIIDRRVGSCQINRGIEFPDVNPNVDPISFFVKHESKFIFTSRDKVFEFNGVRRCRGNSIQCASVVTSINSFPPMVEPDTGKPNGETWDATNMEYGWSMRSPFTRPPSEMTNHFDYPVYLYLKLFRHNGQISPSPLNIRTEDIEYEFYEMSHELKPTDFDTSICYRSLDLPYLHLGFVLKPSNNSLVDSKYMDRRALERDVRSALVDGLHVSYTRVSDIELDHIRFDNSVYALFTLLGPVPLLNNDEPSINEAQQRLEGIINAGQFTFNMTLLDYDRSQVVLRAQPNSLKVSKQFMSIHASSVYANVSNCNISNANTSNTNFTNANTSHCQVSNVNSSYNNGQRIKQEKYTSAAQAGGIIGGLMVGIVLGFIVLGLIQFLNKKTTLTTSPIIGGGLTNKSFHKTRPVQSLSMRNLQGAADNSND